MASVFAAPGVVSSPYTSGEPPVSSSYACTPRFCSMAGMCSAFRQIFGFLRLVHDHADKAAVASVFLPSARSTPRLCLPPVDVSMAKRKVGLTTFYSLSAGNGNILTTMLSNNPTMNPTNVTTAALVTAALAGGPGYYKYPDTTTRLDPVVGSLKFALTKNVASMNTASSGTISMIGRRTLCSPICPPMMQAGWVAARRSGCI
jgi:hypothetical protein